jgi:malate synthase
MSTIVAAPEWYTSVGTLKIHPAIVRIVEESVCPGTGVSPKYFWACLEQVTAELRPELEACLKTRDDFQAQIDAFHERSLRAGTDMTSCSMQSASKAFLEKIGYLEPDQGPVSVATQFVDDEIALIPAPQLVVPSDNARYVLNAVNARWCSLYDALYGFDVIPDYGMSKNAEGSGGYSEVRGEAVIEFACNLLDEIIPLAVGKWSEVTRLWPKFVGDSQQLELLLVSGQTTSLKQPSLFVGSTGSLGPPRANPHNHPGLNIATPNEPDCGRIFLKHNGLHMVLEIDRAHPIGKAALSGIKDITVESALTAILDMEDSVSAVDAEDKARVYGNICSVLRGCLEASYIKDGKAQVRRASSDLWFRDRKGDATSLPGRALCLVRNVGHHMFSDMVITADGKPIPEGFLDCLVTVASALHDLRGSGQMVNSRTGSVYIVKPKQHGSREVALTSALFGRAEEFFGLRRNTVKMGIMDEERRTSANLRECLRVAAERVFFINTGFLDRTGDEIHTCMLAGPVVRKGAMRSQLWIKAYEDQNVDIGLFSGFQGKGQIGKGMWAKPDSMKGMLEAKIAEPMAGASTAWVPSPSAGALHSIHYHRVDVPTRQMQLAMRPPRNLEHLLTPPLLKELPDHEAILHELRENAQSILGYVVRWVDLGVGCSKVPDLDNVGLMEDRATLRISSQIMANWLHHGLITEQELREAFKEMAHLVDQQNARDKAYRQMSGNLENNVAYQAALQLVLEGRKSPNGYTEFVLHDARRKAKARAIPSRL